MIPLLPFYLLFCCHVLSCLFYCMDKDPTKSKTLNGVIYTFTLLVATYLVHQMNKELP